MTASAIRSRPVSWAGTGLLAWVIAVAPTTALAQAAAARAAPAANPLLGLWTVQTVPGDTNAMNVQCRYMSRIEFRDRVIVISSGQVDARRGDSDVAALAAGSLGTGQRMLGADQPREGAPARVTYEHESGAWFVLDRNSGQEIFVIQPRGAGRAEIVRPLRCLLTKMAAGAAAGSPGTQAGATAATPAATATAASPVVPGAGVAPAAPVAPGTLGAPVASAGGVAPAIVFGNLGALELRLGSTSIEQVKGRIAPPLAIAADEAAPGAPAHRRVLVLSGVRAEGDAPVDDARLLFDARGRLASLRLRIAHKGQPRRLDQRVAVLAARYPQQSSPRPVRTGELMEGSMAIFATPQMMVGLQVAGPALVETYLPGEAWPREAEMVIAAGPGNPMLGTWSASAGVNGGGITGAIVGQACSVFEGMRFDIAAVHRADRAPARVRYAKKGDTWIAREQEGPLPYTYVFQQVDARQLRLISPAECHLTRRAP